ncbi:hypothetical protein HMPREF9141_2039 [Prevotella multiformis DSM 16608]|uniref:Uncharacterized protein n=1 Tax=Prevotella multiformis DSM 16608 TaxID=888743 RepID=F0F8X2_9BACT|nr:hypothetical protein HMPREF9141_2039 [Prevotella multiformis DSM 16608]
MRAAVLECARPFSKSMYKNLGCSFSAVCGQTGGREKKRRT